MDALKLIMEPHRREILRLVWDKEVGAGDVADSFDVSFGAVSQHLATLRNAGFVTVRKDGNSRLYKADKEALGPLAAVLMSIWATSLDSLVDVVESDKRQQEKR